MMKGMEKRMKKTVNLTGRIVFPLSEGNSAYIGCEQGILKTSAVVNIKEVNNTHASFETMNSIYDVVLVAESAQAVSTLPMCA